MAETKVYEARFVKSKKEGRMGISLDEWNGFFVNGIRKFDDRKWEAQSKTWFFNASDYEKVKKLVVESFVSPLMVVEINGKVSLHNM